MQPFLFHAPTKICFGEGTVTSTADLIKELGAKKTLIVTDANLIKAGLLEPLLDSLRTGNLNKPPVFADVPSDSNLDCVKAAWELACAHSCDSLVALGGGSVMDTAKAVNICLTYGGGLLDHEGINVLPAKLKPLIAIPTTAGTGSEVSLVAMIMDEQEGKKRLFASPFLAPDVAVLDPALIVSLPPHLTAATGFDALTHCLESYVASTASPLSDALALESMRLIFSNLERATARGEDLEARAATLVGSTMAGLSFTCAGVGIVHALAHATGSRFATHHGMTNAVFLPYGMEFNLEVAAGRYAYLARFLGIARGENDIVAAGELIDAVKKLIEKVGIAHRLRELGVPQISDDELEKLALLASTDPAIMFNPKAASLEDIISIYKRAY